MKECLLELKDASFSYDGEKNALDRINVKIHKGERIAVLGSNGSGKSTFFLCLNGIHGLTLGDIILNGKKVGHKKKDQSLLCKEVGFVFQDPDNQMIGSTVESEISFGLMNRNVPGDEIKKRMDRITEELNLTQFRNRPPYYLSGGEKKRVTIADILVLRPNILLLDEPTASLDLKNIEAFEKILENDEISGMAVLISIHDVDFAWRWAKRILVFHEGKILSDDTPEHTFADDDLLKLTGLKKPVYYTITEALCRKEGIKLPEYIPKNDSQFYEFLENWG